MPNNTTARVRDAALDPRVARTTHALGRALIELVQERDFGGITVQDILDRARVGRTTFYAHYRNKEDVLHSSYDRLFDSFGRLLDRPGERRLFPVAEFLAHVHESRSIVGALGDAGQLDDLWSLAADYAARLIEGRIACWGEAAVPVSRPLAARMLAGALVETMKWWLDHPDGAAPAELDAAFHALARGVLRPAAAGPVAPTPARPALRGAAGR